MFSVQRPLQWYQSLDLFVDVGAIRIEGVVGVDVFDATFPRTFCILRHGGIEVSRTNFTRPRTIEVPCQVWNRSLVRGRVKLVRATSIQLSHEIQNTREEVATRTSTPKTHCVLIAPTSTNRSRL